MATGAFWNVGNPKKPWGLFDAQAELDFPIDWSEWFDDAGLVYGSHTVRAPAPLECVQSSEAAGVITVRIKVAVGQTPTVGTKYSFTVHVITSDGQEDERTFYLKISER